MTKLFLPVLLLLVGCDELSKSWDWETKIEIIAEVGTCVPVQRYVECVVKYESGKFGNILGPVMAGQEVKYRRMISFYNDGRRGEGKWERYY